MPLIFSFQYALGVMVWFVRIFIVMVGLGIIYMVFTQETIPVYSRGHMLFKYSLWNEPVRFIVYFVAFSVFEWFLVRVHAVMTGEANRNSGKRREKSGS